MEEDSKLSFKQFLKDIRNAVLVLLGFVILLVVILIVVLVIDSHRVRTVDKQQSIDGAYELKFQSVGAPEWPYGPISGRLVLKKGRSIISKTSFEIFNDGTYFTEDDWSVTWYDDYVEVILSGEEQYDERIILYFDGQVEREELDTHYGRESW